MKTVLVALLVLLTMPVRGQSPSLKSVKAVQVDVVFFDGEGTGPCSEKVLAKSFGLLVDPIRTETECGCGKPDCWLVRAKSFE